MRKKILIVEDEVLISEHLKRVVQNLGYQAMEICGDYEEAMKLLKKEIPDMAFLDIRMNGVDEGVEVAKYLRSIDIPFIFITSFSDKETLKNAVNQQPVGYVLKPFTKEEIQEQLRFLEEEITGKFLTVGSVNNKERIAVKDIFWLRSENVYVEIQCENKLHVIRGKLSEICESLPSKLFVRTGQSHIVNLTNVGSVSSDSVFIGENEIPLSKKYKADFFEKFADL